MHPVYRNRSVRRKTAALAGAVLACAATVGAVPDSARSAGLRVFCAGPDPYLVQLYPTAHANFARGSVTLRFAASPFGVTVTSEGHHLYEAELATQSLPRDAGVLVAWAATPELDRVQKLGTITGDGSLNARIAFNKFLVFVTAEASADVERWSGPILLRGISPSGRMHTMAGHGPFQGESCAAWGFGPGTPGAPRAP